MDPIANTHPTSAGSEADANPLPEIRLGLIVGAVFLIGFVGWAALTPLDAATYAPGEVVVEGHRVTIQHREGGVVQKINVIESQHVNSGDILIELSGAEVQAAFKADFSQYLALKAEEARLQAEQSSLSTIAPPAEFASLTGADRDEADGVMRQQQAEFRARALATSSRKSVLMKQVGELNEQVAGFEDQIKSSTEERRLVLEDLKSIQTLADQGYAPMSQVRALQRSEADLDGRIDQYRSGIAQAQQRMGEVRLQSLQVDTDEKQEVAKALHDVDFQLGDLVPKLAAAREQFGLTQIRAPQAGRVVGLSVFRVGGVVAPGQRIMDIVPDEKTLVVAAQVAPKDIEGLHVGMDTEVQLGTIRNRVMPILKGRLAELSADTLANEKTGAQYFAAEVTIPQDQLDLARKASGANVDIRAGLPAQVLIPKARRTALDFLLEPLNNMIWRSFRER